MSPTRVLRPLTPARDFADQVGGGGAVGDFGQERAGVELHAAEGVADFVGDAGGHFAEGGEVFFEFQLLVFFFELLAEADDFAFEAFVADLQALGHLVVHLQEFVQIVQAARHGRAGGGVPVGRWLRRLHDGGFHTHFTTQPRPCGRGSEGRRGQSASRTPSSSRRSGDGTFDFHTDDAFLADQRILVAFVEGQNVAKELLHVLQEAADDLAIRRREAVEHLLPASFVGLQFAIQGQDLLDEAAAAPRMVMRASFSPEATYWDCWRARVRICW